MPPLNPERLRMLRQFYELTQTELADRIAVSQPMIAAYEAGDKQPQDDVAEALAVVLRVRTPFLYQTDDDFFSEAEYNFRRGLSATERLKKKVIAQAGLFGIIVRSVRRHVPSLPKLDIPSFAAHSDEDVEIAAEHARIHWGLGTDVPIESMVRVLEGAGVLLTVADEETATKVDAFSRYGNTSVVVLNTAKQSPSRSFFDTAHECAHGVLHYRQPAKALEEREREADRFAGAFLLPRRGFTRDFWSKGGLDWGNLFEIKRRWGASLAAILVRAYQLNLIDAVVYRRAFRTLSQRGWRTAEPEEPAAESPTLFTLALKQYEINTGGSTIGLAEETHFTPELFAAVSGVSVDVSRAQGVMPIASRFGTNN